MVGDGGAGLVDGASGVLCFDVDGGGVVPVGGEVGEHGFDDGGVWRGGGGVVEVDAVVEAGGGVGSGRVIGGGHWVRVSRGRAPGGD